MTRRQLTLAALKNARKASRADRLDRRIPVLDPDFDKWSFTL